MSEWAYLSWWCLLLATTPSHYFLSESKVNVSQQGHVCVCLHTCACACADERPWANAGRVAQSWWSEGVSDALGSRLSARLMEGATLGRPLTDRCQPGPSSTKHQVAGASSPTVEKDDDTDIAHSANADTHGACTPFWACHLVRSIGREMRWS